MEYKPSNKRKDPSWQLYHVVYAVDATGHDYVWAEDEEHALKESAKTFIADSDNTEICDAVEATEVDLVTDD